MGNFTRKPKIAINDINLGIALKEFRPVISFKDSMSTPSWVRIKTTTNKGKEAITVYSIRYNLALTRSGCPPQPKIIKVMGINLNSNKT